MRTRIVLALTALAVIGGGAVAASADQADSRIDARQHQFCVIIYHDDGRPPTPICVNW